MFGHAPSRPAAFAYIAFLFGWGCTPENVDTDTLPTDEPTDLPMPPTVTPNAATSVESFTPGETAGFGQEDFPDIVLGSPKPTSSGGSLDVLSLGERGEIILGFALSIEDGDGPDIAVYENPFPGWNELGEVSVSEDGETWYTWPCDTQTEMGCAGVTPTGQEAPYTLDPALTGGDLFDLADLDLPEGFSGAFVRITDSGTNPYEGQSGGFDLDAVVLLHPPLP